jgi:hypothetical protein
VTEGQLYGQLLYRPTYHDLLDNPIGYPEGAQIAIANTEVRFLEEGEVELNRLDLIDISSLSAVDLFFGTPSWHVKTGYEDVYSNDTEGKGKVVGAYYLNAGIGFATKITPSVLSYLLTDARVEHNVLYKPFFVGSLGVSAGVLAFNSWGTLKLSAETDYFNNNEYRVVTLVEQNVPLSLDDAIRIKFSQEWHRGVDIYDASLTYRHYF